MRESDAHPISPKTPAPQYQPIDRKKRKGKRVEYYCRDRAAEANKEALVLLLKPASPTPSKTGLERSFQKDTEKGINVLLYCKVLYKRSNKNKKREVTFEKHACRTQSLINVTRYSMQNRDLYQCNSLQHAELRV